MRALFVFLLLSTSSAAVAQQRPLDAVAADRIRIRAHLEQVEGELRAADTSHLTVGQREARASRIDRLHAYWIRGEFPHGSAEQPGMRVPTFIDADGRACAMGDLVIESGHRGVAQEIARAQNYARVPEIVHPALGPWLDANGMTLAEATRVQPAYCWEDCADAGVSEPVCGANGRSYTSTCLATCYGTTVTGPAACDDAGMCSCPDAGAPIDASVPEEDGGSETIDAAGIDAAAPQLDGGSGGTVSPGGGCSATHARSGGAWLLALGLALVLARRRRSAR